MSNLLELIEVKESAVLAATYEDICERKEVYLKSLILEALKKQFDFIETENSLFYSRKFYAHSGLFDFYVNNNVFDLVVLKPDSNELLFNSMRDELHSNVYGYVVVRLKTDLKFAEAVGYFLGKDFENVISDGQLDIEVLTDINLLKEVDALELQLSLEDVSERFFELISEFSDDELEPQSMSELACLLYNSTELRQVFAEIGRFDNICFDIKNNQDLLQDDFLSVLTEDNSNFESSEDDEIFMFDDLDELAEEEPQSVQPEDINLGLNLSELSQDLEPALNSDCEPEKDILDEIATETEDDEDAPENIGDIALETFSDEDIVILEQDENILSDIEHNSPSDVVVDADEEVESVFSESEQDGIEFNLGTEDEEDVLIDENNETALNISDKGSEDILISEVQGEHDSVLQTDNDGIEFDFDEVDLDNLEEFDKKEDAPTEKSNLAAELAALSAKKLQNSESELEENTTFDLSNQDMPEYNKSASIVVDDELLSILGEKPDENILVGEDELLSILGVAEERLNDTTSTILPNTGEAVETIEEEKLGGETKIENGDINKEDITESPSETNQEFDEDTMDDSDDELKFLYTSETSTTTGTFPGDGIIATGTQPLVVGTKTKAIIVASLLTLIVAGGCAAFMLHKGDKYDNDVASNIPQNAEPTAKDDFSLQTTSPEVDSNYSMPLEQEPPVGNVESNSNETKIVSSLSKQAGAAPVILKAVAWQVPSSMTNDAVFSKYLQIAGKNIKLNLATDLLSTDDFAYNNKIKVSMTVKNNSPVKNLKIVESSGSKDVDEVVLQSIKQTLKYINSPVMSTDTGDRDVVLVISI